MDWQTVLLAVVVGAPLAAIGLVGIYVAILRWAASRERRH